MGNEEGLKWQGGRAKGVRRKGSGGKEEGLRRKD
jgi:hypothetical protein